MSPCKKCQKNVADSDKIFCRGFCGAVFHMICAKVDYPLLDQLALYEGNMFWMCDTCAANFANRIFPADTFRPAPAASGAPDALSSLQADVSELKAAILSLTAKIDKQPSQRPTTPLKPRGFKNGSQLARTTKHRRNGTAVGGPVTYANCGREPKTLNVTMQTVDISDEGGDELLHLYLSAFEPTTSEDDVAQLVREFLDMEDSPKVQKLVPKGKDLSTLSFVSFKVSVRPELKQVAFAHGTWPTSG